MLRLLVDDLTLRAWIVQVEMSLLGLDGERGLRHSTFTLNVGYTDVEPNDDDDECVVDFNMKWRSGIAGKDQLISDHLDGAYHLLLPLPSLYIGPYLPSRVPARRQL